MKKHKIRICKNCECWIDECPHSGCPKCDIIEGDYVCSKCQESQIHFAFSFTEGQNPPFKYTRHKGRKRAEKALYRRTKDQWKGNSESDPYLYVFTHEEFVAWLRENNFYANLLSEEILETMKARGTK